MSGRLAIHWTVVLCAAAIASLTGALPFTGWLASAAGTFAAASVGCIGYVTAPNPTRRKDVRP